MSTVPAGDQERIVEWARGIVTGELLVADLSNTAWQISLALMIPELAKMPNLGAILVPKGPHLAMHWVNNTAPGVTVTCTPIAREDLEALDAEIARMNAALYPQDPAMEESGGL